MLLKFPEPMPVKVKVEETLLQIVDMQYDFCDPNGAFYVPMTEMILPNIKKLLDRARELDMVVVHQDSHGYPTPGEKRWKRLRGSFNGWYGPVVDELLENLPEIDTAIVVGVKTNVCVLYTVAGYCIRGYRVIVPMDCVAAMNDEIQAMALNVIANLCPAFPATITTSEMITFV
jgi:nicotinamidase-related amidase